VAGGPPRPSAKLQDRVYAASMPGYLKLGVTVVCALLVFALLWIVLLLGPATLLLLHPR